MIEILAILPKGSTITHMCSHRCLVLCYVSRYFGKKENLIYSLLKLEGNYLLPELLVQFCTNLVQEFDTQCGPIKN